MIADNMGLAMAVSLSYACRNDPRARQLLPLLAFPLLATGDLCSIYRELKSIHLRNLNKERAEIVAEMWLEAGRIPSAAEVCVQYTQPPIMHPSLPRPCMSSTPIILLSAPSLDPPGPLSSPSPYQYLLCLPSASSTCLFECSRDSWGWPTVDSHCLYQRARVVSRDKEAELLPVQHSA